MDPQKSNKNDVQDIGPKNTKKRNAQEMNPQTNPDTPPQTQTQTQAYGGGGGDCGGGGCGDHGSGGGRGGDDGGGAPSRPSRQPPPHACVCVRVVEVYPGYGVKKLLKKRSGNALPSAALLSLHRCRSKGPS